MTYRIQGGAVRRELPLCPLGDGTSIAFLDVLGDPELLDAFAEQVRPFISDIDV